ncbi:hypothetical protein CHRYSEOSP005_02670 [Chryseobacterium sp. Alg-005]|uniref:hypothetical protein n=1 Tax=Chryseobacterium sp. Alg-005 TaxID=3159516 RepID=UPI003555849B
MSNIGKIIRVNTLPPEGERETNVLYQVAVPGTATYTDYAIDENGDAKTPVLQGLSSLALSGKLADTEEIHNGVSHYVDTDRRIFINGAEQSPDQAVMYDALVSGWNVLPNMVGKQESDNGYNSRYTVQGCDIFEDFTGNTDYRPSHPAHDSLIAFGNILGKGVVDGTNLSLFGTAVFPTNDVPIWDSVTGMGKGICNAKMPHNAPNRVATASNGFNLRNMMSGVVAFGNEIWAGDFHTSTLVGANIRNFRYVFNSVVLGNNIMDLTTVKYPGEAYDIFLDNDVILGNGIYKDPKRHQPTHNFIVGSTEFYGSGTWDPSYKPLIEGNFKDKYLGVNGKSINHIQDEYHKIPTENVSLGIVNTPPNSNATYDTVTKKLTLNLSPAGTYRLFDNLIPGEVYLFTIYSNIGSTGTWGYNVSGVIDSGNPDSWLGTKNQLASVSATSGNNFDLLLEGTNITGDIYVELNHVKNNEFQDSVYEIRDYYGDKTFEIRTGNASEKHVAIGKNSASKYASGANNTILGTDSLTSTNSINTTTVIGNDNFKAAKLSRLNQVVGHNIVANAETPHRIVALGQDIAPNAQYLSSATLIGTGALQQFKGTYNSNSPNPFNEIVAVGGGAGFQVEESKRSVFLGAGTGWCKDVTGGVIIGNRSRFKDSATSVNEIVIGEAAVGNGNNTATIGNENTTDLYIGGTNAGITLKTTDGLKNIRTATNADGLTIKEVGQSDPIISFDSTHGARGGKQYAPSSDLDYVQKKYVDDSFIPSTGTPSTKPITGDIYFAPTNYVGLSKEAGTDDGLTERIMFADDTGIDMTVSNSTKSSNFVIGLYGFQGGINDTLPPYNGFNYGFFDTVGYTSAKDFTNAIGDLDYTQKKYVDDKVTASRPYKVYTALLNFQAGTFDPSFVVLENTIGDIVWSKTSTGEYVGELADAFTSNKAWSQSQINSTDGGVPFGCRAGRLNDDQFFLSIFRNNDGSPASVSGTAGTIEIRVYN